MSTDKPIENIMLGEKGNKIWNEQMLSMFIENDPDKYTEEEINILRENGIEEGLKLIEEQEKQRKLQEGLGKTREIDLTQNSELIQHILDNLDQFTKSLSPHREIQATKRRFSILNPEERKQRLRRRILRQYNGKG